MKNEIFITNNFEETQKAGEGFVSRLNLDQGSTLKARVIALYGDLGSGKTTFIQGLAKGLGIKKRIISPTFNIVRKYELRIMNYELRFEHFYHIDLYRVQSLEDIKGLGIEEIINDPQNIVAIEWAEKMGNLLFKERVDIKFEYLAEEKRKISISR
ncbi:MAG: tRNA (adenosine(37)-N6)-threonylcarbamoyltransferase complex ATPase subunit type 1 TsaE [Candidatus Levybacteria bacterium]|nr:tRNA (adenosine(37)-N6)-threonylcarbamoyltransferase complex ATPase subunit type 1 TsaE [Candidatus Levybacteria bacterium]